MNPEIKSVADLAVVSTRRSEQAGQLLRRGLARVDADVASGRSELREALRQLDALDDRPGRLLAAAALVQCIGIADDDYTGFEEAVDVVNANAAAIDALPAAGDLLLARAGLLVSGWFRALDDPALPALADTVVRALADAAIEVPVRARAGLAALGFHEARLNLEDVLWVELAMRPLLADAGIGARLSDEWHHMLVQGFYQCGAPERAGALRAERAARGHAPLPAIELKLLLLEAQLAIGEGRGEAGRVALGAAMPLLGPLAPRPASWWHLLRSRLHLLEGQHRDALIHARLALRLAQESRLPERWMGVTVMQEGQVQVASGLSAEAVPFFERAGRSSSGAQADFCWCLAHFARALAAFDDGLAEPGREHLKQGFAIARRLQWMNFLRACPKEAASLCALALEHDIETAFVRETIAARGLAAARADLAAWPWPVRVTTLGRFRIELDGQELVFRGKVARKPLELLQFIIASSGSDVSTATATFALWRELDGDNAKAALNVALHRLRKLLGNDDAVLLELGRLSLNGRLVWVDCLAFEHLADSVGVSAAPAVPAAASAAQRALAIYGGAFLHDTDDHAWQLVCRTRLASKFKRMVALLVRQASAQGDSRAARALLERALELDPLAEDMARDLMRVLIDLGEQAAALAVFERCRDAIFDALGAKPSPATLVLLASLRAGSGGFATDTSGPDR
jgi:LuxR family maltose regulon positive regulatory protein